MQDTSWDQFRVFRAAIQCAETTQELDSVEVALKLWRRIQCAETTQELDYVEVALKLWRIDGLAWVLGPG